MKADLKRQARKLLKRGLRTVFACGQRLGLNITARHYESPIPYVRELPEEIWDTRTDMIGIDLRTDEQVELIREFAGRYRDEYERFPIEYQGVPGQYYVNNRYFESVDGEALYCFIRYFKPERVIEIGGGNSTFLIVQSMLKNRQEDPGYGGELAVIDPNPREYLNDPPPFLRSLKKMRVQDVCLDEFEALGADDILFIDSSHALSIGSDVRCEILEILPRLKPGVIIHLHDIFLPAEYPRDWVIDDMRFLNEQYLLQAFLAFNQQFEILFAASHMHLDHPALLEEAFKTYRRDRTRPGSFWMRRKPDPSGT